MKPVNVNGADQGGCNCSGSAFQGSQTLVYPAIIHPLPDRAMCKRSQTVLPNAYYARGVGEWRGMMRRKGEEEQEFNTFSLGKGACGTIPVSAPQLQECCVSGLLRARQGQAGIANASASHATAVITQASASCSPRALLPQFPKGCPRYGPESPYEVPAGPALPCSRSHSLISSFNQSLTVLPSVTRFGVKPDAQTSCL